MPTLTMLATRDMGLASKQLPCAFSESFAFAAVRSICEMHMCRLRAPESQQGVQDHVIAPLHLTGSCKADCHKMAVIPQSAESS